MNVYEISYQAALDGEYRERAHHTAWDNYFDRMGARVARPYGDPELELSLDHLQNIVNLTYSGRKQGTDEVVIELDNERAKPQLREHSYVFGYLPEVLADFELEGDQPMLRVTFREGVHTPGYRKYPPGTSPIEKELAGMSEKDLNDRLDELSATRATETILTEIGEDDGEQLLSGLLARSGAPSLAHFVRSLVGMDREAAQAAFSVFLQDRSLTPPQIRFIEMVIEQLTARGVMNAAALYESPFINLHAGGPDELFAGKENVIEGIFDTLRSVQPTTEATVG